MLQDYRQISSPLCRVIKAAAEMKRGPDARRAVRSPAQERIGVGHHSFLQPVFLKVGARISISALSL